MCRVLEVSRAGYYAWRDRKPNRRACVEVQLVSHIRTIHKKSSGTYGSPRIYVDLKKAGVLCGRHKVATIMRKHGIIGKKRFFRVTTTDSRHDYAVAKNLLERRFSPHQTTPDRTWVSDITAIPTSEGWLYLAIILDLYSRRVIGWSMSELRDTAIILDAFRMALAYRSPAKGSIFHSDRGSQYACGIFQAVLKESGFLSSMSRKRDCWDNAVAESFFATMKTELTKGTRFTTRKAARAAIFEYIEIWYNRQRRHSTLGYLSPVEFEKAYQAA